MRLCQAAILVIVTILVLPGCGSSAARTNLAAHLPAQLSVRGFRDAPLVEVTIDGIGPVVMVLDTGSTVCVLGREVATQLPSPIRSQRRILINAEGQSSEVEHVVRMGTLDFGAVQVHDMDAIVTDVEALSRAFGERIAGVLGYPVFANLLLEVDYASRSVTIVRAPPEGAAAQPSMDSRLPVLRADVAGVLLDILIDTASSGGWALPIERMQLEPGSSGDKRIQLIDGVATVIDGRLDGVIRLGEIEFDRPLVESTRGTARAGARALDGLRITFDHRAGMVYVERVTDAVPGAVRGIGAELRPLEHTWELWSVQPGLPAHALGLRDGEIVLAVDGMRVDQIDPGALRAHIASAGRVRLDLLRAHGVEPVYVPVVYIAR